MNEWWPRMSRGSVDSPPRADADLRWGVARLVAQREAERQARAGATDRKPTVTDTPASADGDAVPPAPRAPAPRQPVPPPAAPPVPRAPGPPAPPRPLPVPRRPAGHVPGASDSRAPRPRVEPDLALFGFARHTRGRLGSRLFALFFVLVFAVIMIQTVVSIL